MTPLFRTLSATALIFSSAAQAGDWSGNGDLGYNAVSGNSNSDSLAMGFLTTYDTQNKWVHEGQLKAYVATQDEATTAETYTLRVQTEYEINEKTYGYGSARYLDDRFSGYEYQASTSVGLGRIFIDDSQTLFSAQAGLGYRKSELTDNLGDESEAIISLRATYNHSFNDATAFESTWITESGDENTYLEGSVALVVSMTDALGLKVAYSVQHNTDVPAGTTNTDRYTTVSLNYQFD